MIATQERQKCKFSLKGGWRLSMFQVYVPLQVQRQSTRGLGRASGVDKFEGNFLEDSFLLGGGWSSQSS